MRRGLRWGVVVVAWAAGAGLCACSGTNLVGDAGDVPPNPAETVGTPCTASAECDDGEACNGEESCSAETGRCIGGVALADFTQCETSDGRFASCVDARCDLDYEEMFVPAGPFVMGCDPDDPEDRCPHIVSLDPSPELIVEVSAYFVDRYEVTNARYRRCQRMGACPPGHPEMSGLNDRYFSEPRFQQYPVVLSPQSEADALCAFEGKRLPTEAEWEKAGRGGCELVAPASCGQEDERLLPWDDPPLGDEYRTCENAGGPDCYRDTKQVGSHPSGRSPYGVDEMLGNVEEWTSGCAISYADCAPTCVNPWAPCAGVPPWGDPPLDVTVARGGSFMENADLIFRSDRSPFEAAASIGFRCVRPAPVSKSVCAAQASGPDPQPSWNGGRHDLEESVGRVGPDAFAAGMPIAGGCLHGIREFGYRAVSIAPNLTDVRVTEPPVRTFRVDHPAGISAAFGDHLSFLLDVRPDTTWGRRCTVQAPLQGARRQAGALVVGDPVEAKDGIRMSRRITSSTGPPCRSSASCPDAAPIARCGPAATHPARAVTPRSQFAADDRVAGGALAARKSKPGCGHFRPDTSRACGRGTEAAAHAARTRARRYGHGGRLSMKSHTVVTAALVAALIAPAAGASEVAVPAEATVVVTPVATLAPAGEAPAIAVPPTTLAPIPGPTTVVETPGSSTVTVTCPPTQIIVIPPPPPPVVVTTPPPVIVTPPQTCPACPPPPPPAPPPPPVPTTELHFTSNDDEQYIISIYIEEPVWDYEAQCMTPCVLHVPNGSYYFMAGGHRTFDVYAVGDTQYWLVEDNSQGGIVLGSIMTGIGGIIGFSASLTLGFSDHSYSGYGGGPDYNETAAALTGAGFGTALLGLTIWVLSYGMADQVRPNDGYLAVGERLGVLPTLFPQQDAAGNDRLALGLSLRF